MKLDFYEKIGSYEIKFVDKFQTSFYINSENPLETHTIVIKKCDNEGKFCKIIAYWVKGFVTYELKFINNEILEVLENEDLLEAIRKAQLALDEFNNENNMCGRRKRKLNIF